MVNRNAKQPEARQRAQTSGLSDASTREIPRDQWESFFNSFSKQHKSWLTSVEILDKELGAQLEAHDLPLNGIALASGGTEETSVAIDVGKNDDEHITHIIAAPTHVRVAQTKPGADEAIEIESRKGETALVHFRSTMSPGRADNIATR